MIAESEVRIAADNDVPPAIFRRLIAAVAWVWSALGS